MFPATKSEARGAIQRMTVNVKPFLFCFLAPLFISNARFFFSRHTVMCQVVSVQGADEGTAMSRHLGRFTVVPGLAVISNALTGQQQAESGELNAVTAPSAALPASAPVICLSFLLYKLQSLFLLLHGPSPRAAFSLSLRTTSTLSCRPDGQINHSKRHEHAVSEKQFSLSNNKRRKTAAAKHQHCQSRCGQWCMFYCVAIWFDIMTLQHNRHNVGLTKVNFSLLPVARGRPIYKQWNCQIFVYACYFIYKSMPCLLCCIIN